MKDTTSLLKQLINCRSETPAHGGALDVAENLLDECGYVVRRLPAGDVDNLWATNSDSPDFVFAGHVDVVPPGDLKLWDSPPFEAVERDGYIIGRGAADMKSGVAAMLCAAVNLQKSGVLGVAVLLTSDEEGDAVHGTRHVVEWLQQQNIRPRYCVVGEPTCTKDFGDTIKIGRRGSLTARITMHGVQTHIAYPHRGDNPNHRLINALHDLLLQFPASGKAEISAGDFPPTSAQVAALNSGAGAANVIPSAATAVLNFRYAPPNTAELLQQRTEQCLHDAADKAKWECQWTHGASPFLTDKKSRLVEVLQESIQDECGRQAQLSTDGGTSDGRFLRTICTELAEFGVINNTMHEPNEKVRADCLPLLASIYEQTARRLLASNS